MAKRLSGNINLDMIKEAIAGGVVPFEGKKGKYIPVTVWINDDVDQFGNSASISVYNKDKQSATYLGNLKEFDGPAPNAPQQASTEAQAPDLPF